VILPDSTLLAHYVLVKGAALVDGMAVYRDRMLANLEASHGLVFSQPVLLALVAAGLTRDEAYRIVQSNAMRAWEDGVDFRSLLEADDRVPLDQAQLDEAFSLGRAVRNVGRILEALDAVEDR
jgi:adenylosuccinate lyase